MGKRKKSGKKVTVQKRVYKIPKLFPCPFCSQQNVVKITINNKKMTADLECRKCGIKDEEIPITPLTEAIDIYDDWMDSAREANAKFNAAKHAVEEDDYDDRNRVAYVDEPIEHDYSGSLKKKANRTVEDIARDIEDDDSSSELETESE